MSDIQNWNTAAGSGYQYTTAAPDGFPEGSLPSVVNNVVREVMAAIKRRYIDSNGSLAATGTGGNYVVAAAETVSALYDGLRVTWQANHTTPGPATLAWDGTAAKAIKKDYSSAIEAGDIKAGQKIDCIFDATNDWWQVLNVRSNTGGVTIDVLSGTGAQTVFVLTEDPGSKKNVEIHISGVYQHDATYSVSGTTLTFTSPPPAGTDNIEVRIISPAPAATVDDDSVTLAKVAPGTPGGLIVFDAAGDPADIGAGALGQVLTGQGAGAAPIWASGVPTGSMFPYIGSSAPAGYVLATGRTIGSAVSGASERANADCQTLFTLLWNSWAQNEAPVTGGRGASAAADWAANKVIAVPDLKGSGMFGLDNMGGSAAGRITSASNMGANAIVPGGRIGAQTEALTTSQLPSHTHGAGALGFAGTTDSGGAHTHPIPLVSTDPGLASGLLTSLQTGKSDIAPGATNSGGAHTHTISGAMSGATASAGSGAAHSNTPPALCMNIIVKL